MKPALFKTLGIKQGESSLYYGWIIVAMLAITQPVSWGILYYGFSAMLTPMQAETGWSQPGLHAAVAKP